MFNRSLALVAAAALGAAGISPDNASSAAPDPFGSVKPDFYRDRRGKGQNNKRGKGKSNPPKSRPNRLTISKRVRRKHRRAAK